jgi:hypothetical protein
MIRYYMRRLFGLAGSNQTREYGRFYHYADI